MGWPIATDFFAVQWVWQAPSGLPTDVFTNTWYFRNTQSPSVTPIADRIESVLTAFWTTAGSADQVIDYIPAVITAQPVLMKTYDLGTGPPRSPVDERNIDLSAFGAATTQLPREVACVLSYYAGRQELEPPINGNRRRGRLYIGPLATGAIAPGLSGAMEPALRTALAEAALNVRDTTEDVNWHQLSQTNGTLHPVTGGWVDDAFDTQRSRGREPTSRVTWGDPLAT
jgi:hypothetical protein